MFNIPRYQRYNGETKIALMDNSTIAFMEQMERMGISAKEVLRGYNKILIPNWVLEEVQDSVYREQYIENLVAEGFPICSIAEEDYTDFVDGEENNLYHIVYAAVSTLAAMKSYLHRNVEKTDPLDMDAYSTWIKELYNQWPLSSENTESGRIRKKNAGEISLTILAEVFSWYYPMTETITIYTQDRDSYEYQKNAHEQLKTFFSNRGAVDVSYKSNDAILCQMYRNGTVTLSQVRDIRKDDRVIVYTRQRQDKSVALISQKIKSQEFVELIQDDTVQIIF